MTGLDILYGFGVATMIIGIIAIVTGCVLASIECFMRKKYLAGGILAGLVLLSFMSFIAVTEASERASRRAQKQAEASSLIK